MPRSGQGRINPKMTEAEAEAEAEAGSRDARGEWQPDQLPRPSVLFSWPLRLMPILKLLFGYEGLLWPKNALYMVAAVVAWVFLTPDLSRTTSFSVGWIGEIYLRNVAFVTLLSGSLHLRLYVQRAQGRKYKFNPRWLSSNNKAFLFKNQAWDNMFWSVISGCLVWTAFEAVTLWAYANELLPYVSWREHPVYCVLMMVAVLFMRQLHFYWTHRILHWSWLYRSAHYLHHKNVNIGPWSGLSMHPIEHLIYFSGVLLHWVIPSHPLHAMFHLMHAGLAPAAGHAGFHKFVIKNERAIKNGSYFHYLHHRFFECNFGDELVPLDKWFGSFHDGSPEAHTAMRVRSRIGPQQVGPQKH